MEENHACLTWMDRVHIAWPSDVIIYFPLIVFLWQIMSCIAGWSSSCIRMAWNTSSSLYLLVLLGFGWLFPVIFSWDFRQIFFGESMLEHLWAWQWWLPSKSPTKVSWILWFPKFILHLGFSKILEIDYGLIHSSSVREAGSGGRRDRKEWNRDRSVQARGWRAEDRLVLRNKLMFTIIVASPLCSPSLIYYLMFWASLHAEPLKPGHSRIGLLCSCAAIRSIIDDSLLTVSPSWNTNCPQAGACGKRSTRSSQVAIDEGQCWYFLTFTSKSASI